MADEQETTRMLSSALATAFAPALIPRESVVAPSSSGESSTESAPTSNLTNEQSISASTSSLESEKWKVEYEEHLRNWRAESAEAREKAEKERARWEALRVQQDDVIYRPTSERPFSTQSPSPADARDLVSSEKAKDNGSGFSKWDLISREPSVSYPSDAFPTPPETYIEKNSRIAPPIHRRVPPNEPLQPISTALAVFDPDLPTKTRVLALVATLGINLLLPFINGVMLGFGEIFAKNVVGWTGWTLGVSPGTVGVRKQTNEPKGKSEPGARGAAAFWNWRW